MKIKRHGVTFRSMGCTFISLRNAYWRIFVCHRGINESVCPGRISAQTTVRMLQGPANTWTAAFRSPLRSVWGFAQLRELIRVSADYPQQHSLHTQAVDSYTHAANDPVLSSEQRSQVLFLVSGGVTNPV